MPTRAATRAARLLELLQHLAAQPCTAAELARRFRVAKRTIHRDLQELEDMGHRLERRGRRYALQALAVHTATRLRTHQTTRVHPRLHRHNLPSSQRRPLLHGATSKGSIGSNPVRHHHERTACP